MKNELFPIVTIHEIKKSLILQEKQLRQKFYNESIFDDFKCTNQIVSLNIERIKEYVVIR